MVSANSPITVYWQPLSQPSRCVMGLMMMSGVQHEVKEIDFGKNEQKSPEYLQINPNGTCPALTIDDMTLVESHTIMRYVCDSRGLADNWYPKDHKQRALVNSYLDSHHGDIRQGVNNYFIRQVL